MSHTVQMTKLLDGPRHAIVHVYLRSDGLSDDLKRFVIIDPTDDLEPAKESKPGLVIEQIVYDFAGFDASLKFDTGLVEDNYIWVLPEGASAKVDFREFGGFKDRSGLDGTGRLVIDTFGLLSIGDQGSMLLKIRKTD